MNDTSSQPDGPLVLANHVTPGRNGSFTSPVAGWRRGGRLPDRRVGSRADAR